MERESNHPSRGMTGAASGDASRGADPGAPLGALECREGLRTRAAPEDHANESRRLEKTNLKSFGVRG